MISTLNLLNFNQILNKETVIYQTIIEIKYIKIFKIYFKIVKSCFSDGLTTVSINENINKH